MSVIQNYYQAARENEKVFRNILRDLRTNRAKRPMGGWILKDLETEIALDEIFQKYSEGVRYKKFTIIDFSRPEKTTAIIAFQNIAALSGGGAALEYLVKDDDSVEYQKELRTVLSLK